MLQGGEFLLTLKHIDIFFVTFYFNSHPLYKFRKRRTINSVILSFPHISFIVPSSEFTRLQVLYLIEMKLMTFLFKIVNIGELTNTSSLTFFIAIPVIGFTLKEGKQLLFALFSFLYSRSI